MDNPIQQAAKDYLNKGWSPIPLRYRDKIPSVLWANFDAVQDGIKRFEAHANIGVKLGEPSKGLRQEKIGAGRED